MKLSRLLTAFLCAILFAIIFLFATAANLIWSALNAVLTTIFYLLTIPVFYQLEYWLTYFFLLAALITLIGSLLWYPRVRRKFASPIKRPGASVATLVLATFGLILLVQIFLTLFYQNMLYQFSSLLFSISLVMVAARNLVTISLATLHWIKKSRKKDETNLSKDSPLVSIVIPAYNEEKVIGKTIESLIHLNYTNKEIIVVDDGSNDRTLEVAQTYAGRKGIRVLTKPNRGKWHALNTGINAAKGDIVVCIDADTMLDKEAIQHLVKHFDDPKVGAVAGNVKVGNRRRMFTKLQAIEYVTGINLYRRSESYFNAVTVVPGPIGAFRVEALKKAGLYDGDTFAEDADVTLKILKAGYKTVYEPRAIGYTEAPNNLTYLAKHRYRWYRGYLQSLMKHKDLIFNPKYGFLGLSIIPWTLFNGIIYSWFMFFTLIWLLVLCFNPISSFVIYRPGPQFPPRGQGPPMWVKRPMVPGRPMSEPVIIIDFFRTIPFIYVFWFFFFLLLELAIVIYALSIDVKEKRRLVLYILPYKLVYALIIDVTRMLSQLEQIFNYPMKWEKAERYGTV